MAAETLLKQEEIDEFRQSFFYHARACLEQGETNSPTLNFSELKNALRALGLVPTLPELREYTSQHGRNINFASFLTIVNKQKKRENTLREILDGFKAQDNRGTGLLDTHQIEWFLMNYGERLLAVEVQDLFQHGRTLKGSPKINYKEFAENLVNNPDYSKLSYAEPPPDY